MADIVDDAVSEKLLLHCVSRGRKKNRRTTETKPQLCDNGFEPLTQPRLDQKATVLSTNWKAGVGRRKGRRRGGARGGEEV